MFCEPTSKRATLPKTAHVWWNLRIQICEYNGFLHVAQLCEYCLGTSLAETNQSDGCIFPYETRGMLGIGDGILEAFPWPALLPVCHHCPPPLWGGSDYDQHHGFVVTVDRSGDDSVHEGI